MLPHQILEIERYRQRDRIVLVHRQPTVPALNDQVNQLVVSDIRRYGLNLAPRRHQLANRALAKVKMRRIIASASSAINPPSVLSLTSCSISSAE